MEQIQKSKSEHTPEVDTPEVPAPKPDPEIQAHKTHSDELLDEIDALLEENAATFVEQYVQRGGE